MLAGGLIGASALDEERGLIIYGGIGIERVNSGLRTAHFPRGGGKRFEDGFLVGSIGKVSQDFLQISESVGISLCGPIGHGAPVQNIFLENSVALCFGKPGQRIRGAVFLIVVISQ